MWPGVRMRLSPAERRAVRQAHADAEERANPCVEIYRGWKIRFDTYGHGCKYVALNPGFPSIHPAGDTLEEAHAMIDERLRRAVRYA